MLKLTHFKALTINTLSLIVYISFGLWIQLIGCVTLVMKLTSLDLLVVAWIMCTCVILSCRPVEREVKMKKSEMFGFSLETDDRTEEERSRKKGPKNHGLSAFSFGQEAPKAPMDTDYQEEMEETKPQIRFNLNFDKWASPCSDNMVVTYLNTHCCVLSSPIV